MRKRVPAAVLAVLLAWSLAAPALAAEEGGTEYVSQDTFWNWLSGNTSGLLSAIISYGSESVCTVNEDGRHRASSYNYVKKGFSLSSGVVDEPYYKCVCDACGQEFTAYETDVKQSYDTSVAELPAAGVTSEGKLHYQLSHAWYSVTCDIDKVTFIYSCGHDKNGESSLSSFDSITSIPGYMISENSDHVLSCYMSSGNAIPFRVFRCKFIGVAPVDGYYSQIVSPSETCTYTEFSLSNPNPASKTYTGSYTSTNSQYKVQGTSLSYETYAKGTGSSLIRGFSFYFAPPIYEVIPLTPLDYGTDTTYNITTRPTSITGGNYGIIGDNGQITTVTNNNQIVNETNNTYYNPSTGETSTITDWSYDYSDRSYNLTLEGGDTSSVTCGDENITITETTINESGDTIINNYTIYYIIEGSGSGTDPDTHTHDWRETSTTSATCTVPGSRLLICSLCNQTKTETIPALGHTWQVKQSVTTQYDDTGQLIQQGYTIYQCAVCGEQYKSQDGTGPPGGSSNGGEEEGSGLLDKLGELLGSGVGGFLKLVAAFLGGILDGLIALVNLIVEKLGEVIAAVNQIFLEVPQLFTGFLDFLAAIFPFLPPEITLLLTFGVAAVVFVGIIKAIRR